MGPSLQPWHSFTAMFVMFWAVSAYFDHFLMTTVFCIAFGVLAEILVKTVYGGDNEKTKTDLEDDKKKLEDLVNVASNQQQDLIAMDDVMVIEHEEVLDGYHEDNDEQDEDEGPPPLPARDYEGFGDSSMENTEVINTQEFKDEITNKKYEEDLLGNSFEKEDTSKLESKVQPDEEFSKPSHTDIDFTEAQTIKEEIRSPKSDLELIEDKFLEEDTDLEDRIKYDESTEACDTTAKDAGLLIDFTEELKKELSNSELGNCEGERGQISAKIVAEETDRIDVNSSDPTQSPCQLESQELPIDTENGERRVTEVTRSEMGATFKQTETEEEPENGTTEDFDLLCDDGDQPELPASQLEEVGVVVDDEAELVSDIDM